MKNFNDKTIKALFVGILLVLLFIAYQIYQKNSVPTSELECLKLGSNERAAACIKLIKESEPKKEPAQFQTDNLIISNLTGTDTDYCIELSGSIKNTSTTIASNIALRADFTKTEGGPSFHYEVFSPFANAQEQIQPGSTKTFTRCLNRQTYDAVSKIKKWYFSVSPYSAIIFSK